MNLEILYYTRVINVKNILFEQNKFQIARLKQYRVYNIELGKEKIQKQRIVIADSYSARNNCGKKTG